jgi:hypothetical protein
VEAIVGGEGAVDIVGAKRGGEVLVRLAHRGELRLLDSRRAEPGRQGMQRGDDRECVPGIAGVELRDARVPVRRRLDESVLLEPSQRLADGCAAETEPLRDLRVLELLAGLERSVEDGVSQAECARRVRGLTAARENRPKRNATPSR